MFRHELLEAVREALEARDRRRITTDYGTVHDGGGRVTGSDWQLRRWATRPGEVWPCSTLRHDSGGVSCVFGWGGDLVDFATRHRPEPWIDGTELDAWLSDVLTAALEELGVSDA